MAKKNFGSAGKNDRSTVGGIDEARLALLVAQPAWTAEQAEQVLAAQAHSGLPIAQFAARHGLTAGRLYNWKSKLRPGSAPGHQTEAPAGEPEDLASLGDVRLDLENPGERFMYQYVQRATQGPEPMWHLLGIRRQGSVLLCVVRWIQRRVHYSLVQLELTEPALRWKDFPTAKAATEAMEQRCSAPAALDGEPEVAPLIKVQVRDQAAEPQTKPCRPKEENAQDPCITICMPSGVRIQISSSVPKALMRTVLRTMGVRSC